MGLMTAVALPARNSAAWPVSPALESPAVEPPAPEAASAQSPSTPTGVEVQPTGGGADAAEPEPTVPRPRARPVIDAEEPKAHKLRQPPPNSPPFTRPPTDGVVPDRVVMFNAGTHIFVGDGSGALDPGLRAGMLLGGRMGEQISGNAELVVDLLNPNTTGDVSVTELMFDLTFSPLLHFPVNPSTQFLFGPRLGFFYLTESASSMGASASAWGWGWVLGLNAAFVTALENNRRIGILTSFSGRLPEKVCVSGSQFPEMCATEGLKAAKLVSVALVFML